MDIAAGQLLHTKLHGPRREHGLVARPRLIERLNQGLYARLTLVCAPAGYGKSTVLAEWVRDSGIPAAWLSLDQRDNDLYTFLGYFVAALRTLFPEACPVSFRTVAASSPLFPEHMAELLAAELVNLPGPCILVLDDYHRIRASEVQECMVRLLEVLPDSMHLVLACRFDPILPLARYQASGELCEVRGDELRFTLAEATELLTQNLSTDLSAEVIAALHARTEGWIAVLQLAAQSLRRQRDLEGPVSRLVAHVDRQAVGYLLEEFLAQQTETVQDFLLQTSILERFCAPLCAAVATDAHTRATDMYLEQLSRSNPLLLELDDRREWYRYHPLLRDFLRATLAKRVAPEEIGALHHRAIAWYAESGLIDEAFEHALGVGDFRAASHLLERMVPIAMERGLVVDLERRLSQLPREMLAAHPALLIGQALVAQATGEVGQMPALLEAAEAGLSRPDWGSGDQPRDYWASIIEMGWSQYCHLTGQDERGVEYAERALDLASGLSAQLSAAAWIRSTALHYWALCSQSIGHGAEAETVLREALATNPTRDPAYSANLLLALAHLHRMSGRLHQQEEVSRQLLAVTLEAGLVDRANWARRLLGHALFQLNHLDEAVHLFAAVLAEPFAADAMALRDSVAGLALAYQAQRLPEQAIAVVADHLAFLRRSQRFAEFTHAYALQALLCLRQGDLSAAQQAVEVAAIRPEPGTVDWLVVPRLVQARVLLAQGDKQALQQTMAICDEMTGHAAASHNVPTQIAAHTLGALVCEAQGDTAAALDRLSRALMLGLSGGFVRPFLDLDVPGQQGATIECLLRELVDQSGSDGPRPAPLAAYAGRVLAAYQAMSRPGVDVEAKAETVAGDWPAPPVNDDGARAYTESLTAREVDVLRLLAQHYSYKEIAAHLVITSGTVKAHATHIYGKLEADNRRQAVVRARQLGILAEM